ncbi:helix-turn-helix transcriptional regulator [Stappia taiwanensis]|uniref:Helix-turn-helix transcriptional regulator n=1 Tax=Stappia taiwanensis TaxID=992267 RepID=A0A838XP84_9HYPH|nr:helix-turn-helix transcriptional regulator [Stappia taiwanensis]MBA4610396.1 helix-turn-helix transcriptional regulator [Stappia taiwanensis]GGE85322.1 DNA-binding protein [Stappia taiwanensis]
MSGDLPTYLTTREMADLLRVKERKIYDLAAAGEVPHSRATGKLLFPREEVLAWIANASDAPSSDAMRPPVVLGSHDPLLEWALRESGSGLAALFDGSLDGLDRFEAGEGIAAGLHVVQEEGWNTEVIARRFRYRPVVLVEWAWRSRGFIVAPGNPAGITRLADLAGRQVVRRQAKAGGQLLLERLVAEEGLTPPAATGPMARDEREAALAVLDGRAEVAFGLEASARQFKLDFVPVCEERFDLLVSRRDWFEPPFQAFVAFCGTPALREMAATLGGYRIERLWRPHFNGG